MAGDGWMQTTIGDVCEGIFDGPHATPKKMNSGPVFLGISSLVNGRLNLSGSEHLSEGDYIRWTRRVTPQPDDIVFSYETRLGEAARVPLGLRCCLGRRMALMRPNPHKIDPRFLLYLFLAPTFQTLIHARTVHGSTVNRIPLLDFPSFPITIPPLREQKAVAHVLGTLDDKIELNRQMNETLEAMARAIFKSWFVDFDPVRAKAEGRDPHLPKRIAGFFPSRLERSELGEIPQGWRCCRWGELATLEYGKGLRGYEGASGRYRVFGTNGPIGWHDEALCPTPGIVIGRKGAYRGVHFSPEPFFVIDTAFYLKPKDSVDLKWAYYEILRLDINGMDSGSAIPSTSREDFCSIPTCVPPLPIQKQFGAIVESLFKKKYANERESHILAATRDALLPKLLSNTISIDRVGKSAKETL